MIKMHMRLSLLLSALLLCPVVALAQRGGGSNDAPVGPPPTIASKTAAMKHIPGFLPLDWDAAGCPIHALAFGA